MNTISKIFSGAALLSVALFSSCQRGSIEDNGLVNPLDARDGSFTIVGNLANYQTRAHDAVWEAGDKIGAFAFQKGTTTAFGDFANVEYNTVDAAGIFKASNGGITLKGTETADIVAYYPYSATAVTGTTLAVNVATQDPLKNIDVLWGKGTVTADVNTPTVPVTFTHKLSLVEIKFEAKEGYALPAEMKAKLTGVTTDASLNIADGTLTAGSTKGDLEFTAASNAIQAILIPGEKLSKIDFTFDGIAKSFTFTAPYTLEAGKKYTFTFRPYVEQATVMLEIVAGGEQGSITDWGTDATFEPTDLEYGNEEPGTEEPGTEEPGTEDPATPALALAFPGADFESAIDFGTNPLRLATVEDGAGYDGTKGLHIVATEADTSKTTWIFSTQTTNAVE